MIIILDSFSQDKEKQIASARTANAKE